MFTLSLRCYRAYDEPNMVSNQQIVSEKISWIQASTNLLGEFPSMSKKREKKQCIYAFIVNRDVLMNIGIDHDTVCAGVGGTAIRHSTSCAGRRAAACGRAGRHNECCAWWQYHPRQRRPYKWSIFILPRSQFYKKQGKLAFSTSCTAVRPHRRLRNDAWRRDS